jgi:hypothetical protein
MGATLAATLASIQQPVWTDLFYQGLVQKPIVTNLSQVHDLGGSKGATVNFPIIGAVAATKTADGTTTSYATLSPSDVTATAYEIQSAVMVSRFAQAVTPVKSALQMVNSLMAALANQVEKDLVTEATTPTDVHLHHGHPAVPVGHPHGPCRAGWLPGAAWRLGSQSDW